MKCIFGFYYSNSIIFGSVEYLLCYATLKLQRTVTFYFTNIFESLSDMQQVYLQTVPKPLQRTSTVTKSAVRTPIGSFRTYPSNFNNLSRNAAYTPMIKIFKYYYVTEKPYTWTNSRILRM